MDAGGLDDASALSEVAIEHRQPPVSAVSGTDGSNAPTHAISVQLRVAAALGERDLRSNTRRGGAKERMHSGIHCTHHIPAFEGVSQGGRVHCRHRCMEQLCTIELTQNSHHAARAMHVLQVQCAGGSDLAERGHPSGESVDVLHREIDAAFLSGGQQMQDRIGRASHGDIHRNGIGEGVWVRDAAWKHAFVVLQVVAIRQFDDEPSGLPE